MFHEKLRHYFYDVGVRVCKDCSFLVFFLFCFYAFEKISKLDADVTL